MRKKHFENVLKKFLHFVYIFPKGFERVDDSAWKEDTLGGLELS